MKKGTKIALIVLGAIAAGIVALVVSYMLSKKDLTVTEVDVYKSVTLKDLMGDDVEIQNNKKIDTTKLGEQEIEIEYKSKIFLHKEKVKIKVTDTEAPELDVKSIEISKGDKLDVTNEFKCTDNYDKNPNCYVEGEYDVNTPGKYMLKYVGEDSSKNKSEKEFALFVYDVKTINPSSKGYETVVCTQKQTVSGATLDSTVNVYLGDSKFKGLDMEINIVIPESMASYKDILIETLNNQYKTFETQYGVKPNVFTTSNGAKVTMNMTADQAKDFSGSQNDSATRQEVIDVFGKQGFACK